MGYILGAIDNGQYMLRGDASHPACSTCGMVSDRRWTDPSFSLARSELDASYTYDGYLIVSDRFRVVVGLEGARYDDLPSSPGHYSLTADKELAFDAARRRTRFDRLCSECGRYFDVNGATPVFLVPGTTVPDIISRTDISFGTGDEQHPLILLGPALAARLRAAALSGVELQAIAGPQT